MAFCSKCGTELTEGAKFCPKCGTPNQMTAKDEESQVMDEVQVENEEEKEPIPLTAKIGLIFSALLVIYGIVTINTSSFQGIVFLYCIAIGMLLIIWSAYKGIGSMDKKAAYWTIVAALVSFPIIKGADYLFVNDEIEEEAEKVEQIQKSQAEKQAREKREKEERKKDKINEIKRRAEREARITAQSLRYTENWEKHCQSSYISAFGTPSSDEDSKMYEIYKSEFSEKYFATLKAMQNMN